MSGGCSLGGAAWGVQSSPRQRQRMKVGRPVSPGGPQRPLSPQAQSPPVSHSPLASPFLAFPRADLITGADPQQSSEEACGGRRAAASFSRTTSSLASAITATTVTEYGYAGTRYLSSASLPSAPPPQVLSPAASRSSTVRATIPPRGPSPSRPRAESAASSAGAAGAPMSRPPLRA